jgi:hypothetical protein
MRGGAVTFWRVVIICIAVNFGSNIGRAIYEAHWGDEPTVIVRYVEPQP